MIIPCNVQALSWNGSADMGSLTYGLYVSGSLDDNNAAQFSLPGRYAISFIRAHFAAGSGTADMAINVDSRLGPLHDTLLHTVEAVGTGNDVNWRVPVDELKDWIFQDNDVVVLTWANPDTGVMTWGAEVGLIPVTDA